jgi:hypothetical protein
MRHRVDLAEAMLHERAHLFDCGRDRTVVDGCPCSARVWPPQVYLTPVIVIPAMNCRRANRKAMTSGAVRIVAAAVSAP